MVSESYLLLKLSLGGKGLQRQWTRRPKNEGPLIVLLRPEEMPPADAFRSFNRMLPRALRIRCVAARTGCFVALSVSRSRGRPVMLRDPRQSVGAAAEPAHVPSPSRGPHIVTRHASRSLDDFVLPRGTDRAIVIVTRKKKRYDDRGSMPISAHRSTHLS